MIFEVEFIRHRFPAYAYELPSFDPHHDDPVQETGLLHKLLFELKIFQCVIIINPIKFIIGLTFCA